MGFFRRLLGLPDLATDWQRLQRETSEVQVLSSMIDAGWKPYAENWTEEEKKAALERFLEDNGSFASVEMWPAGAIDESRLVFPEEEEGEKLHVEEEPEEERGFWRSLFGIS